MIVNSESLFEVKPLVTVKGTRDGLLFLLDEQAELDALCQYIQDLLTGHSSKVFDGPSVDIVVDYGKRVLGASEAKRILSLFLERENFFLKGWGGGTVTRQSLFQRKVGGRGHHIYHGLIRAGEPISFDGDVVIIGDVNPSAEVRATGDVFVFGRLRGIAHAGISGDAHAVIAASEFSPMQIRIADVVSRAPQLSAAMEYAYLDNGQIAIAELKHFYMWNQARTRLRETSKRGN